MYQKYPLYLPVSDYNNTLYSLLLDKKNERNNILTEGAD